MLGDFERLAQEFVNPDGQLRFRICGGQDARGRPQLRCRVEGELQMICQRCLKPMGIRIESDHLLYLAASEAEAERLESALAVEEIEVMVVDRTLDLAGVIEDEVLLSVPLVPTHDACVAPAA